MVSIPDDIIKDSIVSPTKEEADRLRKLLEQHIDGDKNEIHRAL
jgi:hypothetical protein